MPGGYILPCSQYLGAANGLLSPGVYIPVTNTPGAGHLEGIQVVGSLGNDAGAVLQFIAPNPIPSGTLKLRSLFQSAATSGNALYTVQDGVTAVGANPGATSLTSEPQQTVTWTGSAPTTTDDLIEKKVTLVGAAGATVGQLITVVITFNTSGWTLTNILSGVHMLVWE